MSGTERTILATLQAACLRPYRVPKAEALGFVLQGLQPQRFALHRPIPKSQGSRLAHLTNPRPGISVITKCGLKGRANQSQGFSLENPPVENRGLKGRANQSQGFSLGNLRVENSGLKGRENPAQGFSLGNLRVEKGGLKGRENLAQGFSLGNLRVENSGLKGRENGANTQWPSVRVHSMLDRRKPIRSLENLIGDSLIPRGNRPPSPSPNDPIMILSMRSHATPIDLPLSLP